MGFGRFGSCCRCHTSPQRLCHWASGANSETAESNRLSSRRHRVLIPEPVLQPGARCPGRLRALPAAGTPHTLALGAMLAISQLSDGPRFLRPFVAGGSSAALGGGCRNSQSPLISHQAANSPLQFRGFGSRTTLQAGREAATGSQLILKRGANPASLSNSHRVSLPPASISKTGMRPSAGRLARWCRCIDSATGRVASGSRNAGTGPAIFVSASVAAGSSGAAPLRPSLPAAPGAPALAPAATAATTQAWTLLGAK